MGNKALLVMGLALVTAATVSGQGVVTDIKSPPMVDSQVWTANISTHFPEGAQPAWGGYAGAIMELHVLDNSEVDVDAVVGKQGGHPPGRPPVNVLSPFGPRSANVNSVPLRWTTVNSVLSGRDVVPSVNQPNFDIKLHAKNTTPFSHNSDTDLEGRGWAIWHVRSGVGSTWWHPKLSDMIWVRSTYEQTSQFPTYQGVTPEGAPIVGKQLPSDPPPIDDPNGHWLHFQGSVPMHFVGGPGSTYIASFLNVFTIGIEHVPEPASGVIALGGIAALVMSRRAQRRRLTG